MKYYKHVQIYVLKVIIKLIIHVNPVIQLVKHVQIKVIIPVTVVQLTEIIHIMHKIFIFVRLIVVYF